MVKRKNGQKVINGKKKKVICKSKKDRHYNGQKKKGNQAVNQRRIDITMVKRKKVL